MILSYESDFVSSVSDRRPNSKWTGLEDISPLWNKLDRRHLILSNWLVNPLVIIVWIWKLITLHTQHTLSQMNYCNIHWFRSSTDLSYTNRSHSTPWRRKSTSQSKKKWKLNNQYLLFFPYRVMFMKLNNYNLINSRVFQATKIQPNAVTDSRLQREFFLIIKFCTLSNRSSWLYW